MLAKKAYEKEIKSEFQVRMGLQSVGFRRMEKCNLSEIIAGKTIRMRSAMDGLPGME